MEGSNLSNGKVVLDKDLRIIEDMAAEMADYLKSDQIFWPKIDNKLVQPTIGGFWLRRQRLEALQDSLLDTSQRQRLDRAIHRFDEACADDSQEFEQKASRELEARVRQWAEALHELQEDDPPSMAYYKSDIEVRAIIEAILDHLDSIPTEAETTIFKEVGTLDRQLKKRWIDGNFIWPDGWEAAYPRRKYWWLYGRLK